MTRLASVLLVQMVVLCGCGSSASPGGSDGGNGFSDGGSDVTVAPPGTDDGGSSPYATLCPAFQGLATCPAAPHGTCVNGDPSMGCAGSALPLGFSCSGVTQCAMRVLPCPNEVETWTGVGRVDAFVCSCVAGSWKCADCFMGQTACGPPPEGGALVDAQDDAMEGGEDAGVDDAPSTEASTVEAGVVSCQVPSGDAATVYTAGIGLGDDAGANVFIVDWVDDAGASQSCGFSSCPAVCPTGHPCSVAYTAHALVITGGTCL